ncbi:hypothetical protein ACH5RR_027822 [Cinchona calisaya]|uniref:glycerophosphodiester phosphodiesterase n=1 Tax=Cinchona calisaya TaxID=153742 RepID=A0ABD2YP42_9GENT
MWKLRSLFSLFLLLCSAAFAFVSAQPSTTKWQTLSGDAPIVVARGGFSGLFPDSSFNAYRLTIQTSLPDAVLWCDVQLTKDEAGICFPDLKLDNASDVSNLFTNRQSTYTVNGVPTKGWFSIDYTLKDLQPISLSQGIYSRRTNFDGTQQILTVEDVATQIKPSGLWLNVQHDAFFSQHNLSMRSFVISVSRRVVVNYISSPEVNFLKSIVARFKPSPTKLVFRFLGPAEIEPSTKQTYVSLLKNLTFIKTFASAILVPKYYIWPVDDGSQYLRPHTSIVSDAHKEGLEVYASEFSNDVTFAYNYNYDPVAEYLSHIDNGNFSVDGVLSDFPITPSAAIDCFSHMGKTETEHAKILIISSEGASGVYPGCTNKAYDQAITDGADIIDCPVQMSGDNIPFCLGSINLIERTTAAQSPFTGLTMTIPELDIQDGIFAFSLNWSMIQILKPSMYNPYTKYSLFRNPKSGNVGNFVQLSDFLAIARNATSVSGVLISIEHAAYLAQNQGLGVVDAVLDALNKSGYTSQTAKKVMIKSRDSSVLTKFGKNSNYELVYEVGETISDITNSTILEVKKFASSVLISKGSVFPSDKDAFLTSTTEVVPKLNKLGLQVYVQLFSNEFVSQAWDFFSDPYVEINTYASQTGISGVVSGYPATAARYRRNRCLGYKTVPPYMSPVPPGGLLSVMAPSFLPPAEAPYPVLTETNVTEPPLPPVVERQPNTGTGNGSTAPGPNPPNGQSKIVAKTFLISLAIMFATLSMLIP